MAFTSEGVGRDGRRASIRGVCEAGENGAPLAHAPPVLLDAAPLTVGARGVLGGEARGAPRTAPRGMPRAADPRLARCSRRGALLSALGPERPAAEWPPGCSASHGPGQPQVGFYGRAAVTVLRAWFPTSVPTTRSSPEGVAAALRGGCSGDMQDRGVQPARPGPGPSQAGRLPPPLPAAPVTYRAWTSSLGRRERPEG